MWKTIFISGPTSSGKSKLSIFLAKKFNGEIINADSRQIYKYLDLGSGKFDVFSKEKIKKTKKQIIINSIPHHLIDIAHPKRNYSLGKWLKDSERTVKKIIKKNKLPIFCGGTILYLKALKEGWQLPEVKPNYKLRKKLEKKSKENLYQELSKLDPQRAKKIDPNNKRRIIRSLEIIYSLGKVPEIKKEPKYQILILSPKIDIELLKRKIKIRLEKRSRAIINEIKKLRKIGLSFKRIISFGLEYKWFGKYVKGEIDLKSAEKNCYLDILRFAKRQIRELKKIENVNFVKNKVEVVKFVENFLKY